MYGYIVGTGLGPNAVIATSRRRIDEVRVKLDPIHLLLY